MKILIIYLLAVNIIGFAVCGMDKRKAIRHQWRVPERTIFAIAIIGGSIGVFLGMYHFRHKTKHAQFVIGIPVILLCQIALVILVKRYF